MIMEFRAFLPLLLLALSSSSTSGDEFMLESPHLTNWGDWGQVEHCPPGNYVYGLRIKVQPSSGVFVDDTALNGIELLCASTLNRRNATAEKLFASITSTVGHKGGWTPIAECSMPSWAVGFQLRSEENQLVADDSAGNDIKLFCSDGFSIGAFGVTDFGDWTVPQNCPRGMKLCGIQTQVEGGGESDETTLNNVNMWCCE